MNSEISGNMKYLSFCIKISKVYLFKVYESSFCTEKFVSFFVYNRDRRDDNLW